MKYFLVVDNLNISLGVMVFNPAANDVGFLCSRGKILEIIKCECLLTACLLF